MKRNTPFLLATVFAAISGASCGNNEPASTPAATSPEPSVFEKLVGTWQKEDGKSYERWTSSGKDAYRAVVYTLNGKDTSWTEEANVFREGDNWVFENRVTGQNDGKAVRFVSSFIDDRSVQFSNPAHDFPTDIRYNLPDQNTVHAFIVGPNSTGGKDTIPFNYTRAH